MANNIISNADEFLDELGFELEAKGTEEIELGKALANWVKSLVSRT